MIFIFFLDLTVRFECSPLKFSGVLLVVQERGRAREVGGEADGGTSALPRVQIQRSVPDLLTAGRAGLRGGSEQRSFHAGPR